MDVRTKPAQSRTCNFKFRPTLRWTNFWELVPRSNGTESHAGTAGVRNSASTCFTTSRSDIFKCHGRLQTHNRSDLISYVSLSLFVHLCLISTPFHTYWCPDNLLTYSCQYRCERLILVNLWTTQTTSTSTDGFSVFMTHLTTQSLVVLTVWQRCQIKDAQILQ